MAELLDGEAQLSVLAPGVGPQSLNYGRLINGASDEVMLRAYIASPFPQRRVW